MKELLYYFLTTNEEVLTIQLIDNHHVRVAGQVISLERRVNSAELSAWLEFQKRQYKSEVPAIVLVEFAFN